MPPSGGRGTKRKVATPAPEPDPVADVDTEGEGQEEEGLSNTDANGNQEGASSSTKKARVDINAVHKEYIQTFKVVTAGKKRKKEEKVWSSACRHCKHVVPNKKPGHLESHLLHKHHDVYEMVESINEERREEILKKRMPKSTRFDEIIDSYIDFLIEKGLPLDTSDSIAFKKFVHKIDPSLEIPGRY